MAALIDSLRRRGPIAWLVASAGLGLLALGLMLAGSPWPLPVAVAAAQAALLATGAVGYLGGESARPRGKQRARRTRPLPRR